MNTFDNREKVQNEKIGILPPINFTVQIDTKSHIQFEGIYNFKYVEKIQKQCYYFLFVKISFN